MVSDTTLNELDTVLRRSRFDRYVAEEKRLQFLATFMQDSILLAAVKRSLPGLRFLTSRLIVFSLHPDGYLFVALAKLGRFRSLRIYYLINSV